MKRMAKSMFRFLSRPPETVTIADADYLLRLPRSVTFVPGPGCVRKVAAFWSRGSRCGAAKT